MGFRDQAFAFDSPAAAVSAFVARLGHSSAHPVERVTLDRAFGRILAEDVRADRDSPAFDHSAMDGYAVRAADVHAAAYGQTGSGGLRSTISLRVVGESRIGREPPEFPAGPAAVRIATGAPIPALADAIIRLEDITSSSPGSAGDCGAISVAAGALAQLKPGLYVRRSAENASVGTIVLKAGEVISAAALGTLAAVGAARPRVVARLRIAVITTGDEVVAPDETPSTFQVRNSNAAAVTAIVASQQWADVVSVTHARDEEELGSLLGDTREFADAVILTGGVSVGHRDPVRAAVDRLGAEIVFHGLPQRPGKPMLGAMCTHSRRPGAVPLFGLPGNPVSAMVTCVRVVLPVLAACAGATRLPLACLPRQVELQNPDGRTLDLWWHRLARLVIDVNGLPKAELLEVRSSGDIVAAGLSDGFLEVPPGASHTTLPFFAWPAGALSRCGDASNEGTEDSIGHRSHG